MNLPNQGAAANSRPALRLTIMDCLNLNLAPSVHRPAAAELTSEVIRQGIF
jgi:hypothetical protein